MRKIRSLVYVLSLMLLIQRPAGAAEEPTGSFDIKKFFQKWGSQKTEAAPTNIPVKKPNGVPAKIKNKLPAVKNKSLDTAGGQPFEIKKIFPKRDKKTKEIPAKIIAPGTRGAELTEEEKKLVNEITAKAPKTVKEDERENVTRHPKIPQVPHPPKVPQLRPRRPVSVPKNPNDLIPRAPKPPVRTPYASKKPPVTLAPKTTTQPAPQKKFQPF